MTLRDFHNYVQDIGDYTPLSETAKAVCLIRGKLPENHVPGPYGPLLAWRGVIMEAMLLDVLSTLAKDENR